MKYRLRQRAREDLETIWETTIERWGLNKSEEYLSELLSALDKLTDNPNIGMPRPELEHGFRSLAVNQHTIYYCIEEGSLDVIRVLHQRMDTIRRLGSTND